MEEGNNMGKVIVVCGRGRNAEKRFVASGKCGIDRNDGPSKTIARRPARDHGSAEPHYSQASLQLAIGTPRLGKYKGRFDGLKIS